MVRLFARHSVSDYAAWRRAYDEFDAERRNMGATKHGAYRSVDDPNDVTVWHDFAGREQAEAFMSSESVQRALEKAGVQGRPTVWLVEEAPAA